MENGLHVLLNVVLEHKPEHELAAILHQLMEVQTVKERKNRLKIATPIPALVRLYTYTRSTPGC